MNEKITQARRFINKQKLYVWLVIFIVIINTVGVFLGLNEKPDAEQEKSLFPSSSEIEARKPDIEAKLRANKTLVILISLAVLIIVLAVIIGLILDLVILFLKLNKKELLRRTLLPFEIGWTAWDVAKVVILFIFFGYMLTLIESILAPTFPFIKTQETLRTAFNTTVLDLLVIWFVLYFAFTQGSPRLTGLGISFKKFFRNFFYGLSGYIATVPLLVLVLLLLVWLAGTFKYEPPPQPILELLVEEKKVPALVYISIFAAILGPIAEEMFFRAFMYNAIKRQIGIKWALVSSSLLFAFLHAHLVAFLPIMVLGIVLAYLYEKTGSLVAPVTMHIIHNSVMIFLVFLMKEVYF